jgi:hypothetical protein
MFLIGKLSSYLTWRCKQRDDSKNDLIQEVDKVTKIFVDMLSINNDFPNRYEYCLDS